MVFTQLSFTKIIGHIRFFAIVICFAMLIFSYFKVHAHVLDIELDHMPIIRELERQRELTDGKHSDVELQIREILDTDYKAAAREILDKEAQNEKPVENDKD